MSLLQCVAVVRTVKCMDVETVAASGDGLRGFALVLRGNFYEVHGQTSAVGFHRHAVVVGALDDEIVYQEVIYIKNIDIGEIAIAGDGWPCLQAQNPFQIGVGTGGAGRRRESCGRCQRRGW